MAKRYARNTAIFLAVCVVWELLYRVGVLNPLLIPAPSLILTAAAKDGLRFLEASRVTAYEILISLIIAWIGGVALGAIIGTSRLMTATFAPIFSSIVAVPLITLYPAIVIFSGLGPASKIVFATIGSVFPVALATLAGIRAADPQYAMMARAMGATPFQILKGILLRSAFPAIVSGLRIGTSFAIICVIIAEMMSATDGLGFWISYYRSLFAVGQVYFGIFLALALTVVPQVLLGRLERHYGSWQRDRMDQSAPV